MDTPDTTTTNAATVLDRLVELVTELDGQANLEAVTAGLHQHVVTQAGSGHAAPEYDSVDLGDLGQVEFWGLGGSLLVLYVGPGTVWSGMLPETETPTLPAATGRIRGELTDLLAELDPKPNGVTADHLKSLRDVVAGLDETVDLADYNGEYAFSATAGEFTLDEMALWPDGLQPGHLLLNIQRGQIVSITAVN